MTATPTAAGKLARMDSLRRTALIAGALYLITFVAGIPPALILYSEVLTDSAFIVGAGGDTAVLWGGLLEIINAVACIGTAVVLYPVVKRQSEAAALGFVTARVMEAAIIMVGVISLVSIVTLRQELAGAAGADAAAMVATGRSLVAVHNWTSVLGPGTVPGFNALLLGYLMYRSRLVPRVIPLMGLVGGPLLLAFATATFFGLTNQFSPVSALVGAPLFFWELSLGLYMLIKGFRPSPITSISVEPARVQGALPVA